MGKLKNLVFTIYFQVGVNVIGLPDLHKHEVSFFDKQKSLFHK